MLDPSLDDLNQFGPLCEVLGPLRAVQISVLLGVAADVEALVAVRARKRPLIGVPRADVRI